MLTIWPSKIGSKVHRLRSSQISNRTFLHHSMAPLTCFLLLHVRHHCVSLREKEVPHCLSRVHSQASVIDLLPPRSKRVHLLFLPLLPSTFELLHLLSFLLHQACLDTTIMIPVLRDLVKSILSTLARILSPTSHRKERETV